MDCEKAISLIHEYFDGDLKGSERIQLKQHLHGCLPCNKRFEQLEKTEALLFTASSGEADIESDLSTGHVLNAVFASAPSPSRKHRHFFGWVKRHPAITAALIFLCIMTASVFTFWEPNHDLVIRGGHSDQLIIEGRTVIVPYGKTVYGDLIVENGEIQVDGQIDGNLVVIDGTVQQASTAKITGKIKPINEKIDRIWYTIGSWFTD